RKFDKNGPRPVSPPAQCGSAQRPRLPWDKRTRPSCCESPLVPYSPRRHSGYGAAGDVNCLGGAEHLCPPFRVISPTSELRGEKNSACRHRPATPILSNNSMILLLFSVCAAGAGASVGPDPKRRFLPARPSCCWRHDNAKMTDFSIRALAPAGRIDRGKIFH